MEIDLHYHGFSCQDQIRISCKSYLLRNTQEGLRDLVAQAIGIFGLMRRGGLTFPSSRARSLRTRVLHRPWQWSLLRERARQTHMAKWNMLVFCGTRISNCALCFSSHFTYLLGERHICTMTPSAHALTSFHHSGQKYPKSHTTFPSLQNRSHWYDLPLLCRHHNVTLNISCPAQNKL